MCTENLRGVEKWKARQNATGDGAGGAGDQTGVMVPPRVAKYNVHYCDVVGAKLQGYGLSPETNLSLIY